MNKIRETFVRLYAVLCVLLVFAGCAKEEADTPLYPEEEEEFLLTTVTASREMMMEENSLGTSLDSKMNLLWSAEDSLKVFADGDRTATFVLTNGAGTTSGTFSCTGPMTLKNNEQVILVYNRNNTDSLKYSDGKVHNVVVSPVQKAVSGSFDCSAVPMVGVATIKDGVLSNFRMKPLCAYVQVKTDASWRSVELSNTGGVPLCSKNLSVSYSGNEPVLTPKDTLVSVLLNTSELKVSDTCYLAVLPGKVGSTLEVKKTDGDGKVYKHAQDFLPSSYSFVRNKWYTKLDFSKDIEWQNLDGIKLKTYNVGGNASAGAGTFFSWKDAQNEAASHPGYRMLNYSDLFREDGTFRYPYNMSYDRLKVAARLNWERNGHYFYLSGYIEDGASKGSGDYTKIWLNHEGMPACAIFDRYPNCSLDNDPKTDDNTKYHLRLVKE